MSRRGAGAKKVWSKVTSWRKKPFLLVLLNLYGASRRAGKKDSGAFYTLRMCSQIFFSDCSTAALHGRASLSLFYSIPVPCTIVHQTYYVIGVLLWQWHADQTDGQMRSASNVLHAQKSAGFESIQFQDGTSLSYLFHPGRT